MEWHLWHDCIDNKTCELLSEIQYNRYGRLPDVKERKQLPKEIFTVDELEEIRLEKEIKPIMTATPEQVKHWRDG